MMRLRRMMLRRKTDPKTGKHTLCEPAQATCAWAFHKSHSVWKFTGLAKWPRTPPGTSFCASRNAQGQSTRAILYGNLQGKQPGHLRRHRFVRACAVEMDINISQEPFV